MEYDEVREIAKEQMELQGLEFGTKRRILEKYFNEIIEVEDVEEV